jgi:hypothetical protein
MGVSIPESTLTYLFLGLVLALKYLDFLVKRVTRFGFDFWVGKRLRFD